MGYLNDQDKAIHFRISWNILDSVNVNSSGFSSVQSMPWIFSVDDFETAVCFIAQAGLKFRLIHSALVFPMLGL